MENESSEVILLSDLTVNSIEESIESGESPEKILGIEDGLIPKEIFKLLSYSSMF